MAKPSRHEVGTGLEHKVRAAGRPWTVGDIAMVADGQWAVGVQPEVRRDDGAVVLDRSADGHGVELTVEELARAVGSGIWMRTVGQSAPAHRDEDHA
ncbi:hypothetical protein PV749_01780 [Streptomyces sp. ID03-2B]|uniref:Uncharacterized protein n=1 Tax=Streptomyces caviscabies TaxID=90079 RepID=A0ABW2MQ85_9ACTN|nr:MULTISPECIES: hypothetical protein [unclassified Streptomyces]MCL6289162.1 hypothetical protein [Streptomyces sp. 43Y-GA-1]MDX3339018.1 hypothetical protein [Streptomyces sp. ME02-6979.5a]MDX3506385.1 hypothetical protein [Streptomyces sp. ATCC51928]MDX3589862.1 hypothetical protein [Streptomyces sp. ID03-2B]MDX5522232.1 hypothetical protein [Streptomyces sp. DE06-01C]